MKKKENLKQKITMEFSMRSSPKTLFSYLSSPNGLAEKISGLIDLPLHKR